MSSFEALALHRDEDLDQRQLDLAQEPLEPELVELLALALGQLPGEPGVDRGVAGGSPSSPERELARPAARRGVRPHGEPGVGRQLVEDVGAPGRIDQVGGDHRVVGELERAGPGRSRAGRGARPRRAT